MSSPIPPSGPSQPARTQIVNEPAQGPIRVVVEQPRRWLGGLGRRLLWVVLLLSVMMNFGLWGAYHRYFQTDTGLEEKYHSLERFAANKVAIVTVEGAIMGDESFIKGQIDRVRRDDDVRAVVLRIDSPGGTVTGSDLIYHQLKKLVQEKQIPLVVSMGSVAASGGYYVAMAAGDHEKTIFAEPTTWTGSIGVVIPHYDLSGLLEKLQIQDDSIASNPLKLMGSPTRKLSEEERAKVDKIMQGLVDASFEDFKQIVLASRSALRNNQEWQQEVFTGRIFTAKQAKDLGLVDDIGFAEDAIARAVAMAGLNEHNVRAIKYTQPRGFMDQVLFGESRGQRSSLAALLELATPRAYYLCTWLPGISPVAP